MKLKSISITVKQFWWTARVIGLLLAIAGPGFAQTAGSGIPPGIPEAGFKAEMQGNWQQAARIYLEKAQTQPENLALWLRLADVQAAADNLPGVVKALKKSLALTPDDAGLHFRLMQAYSAMDNPQQALLAVDKAIELDPGNVTYLMARGDLANWLGRYETAIHAYQKVLELAPEHQNALLNLARAQKWSGRLDTAVDTYARYCKKYPKDDKAFIEYTLAEASRGNYRRAIALLHEYREHFGESVAYRREMGKILAWADRPHAALEFIDPLLVELPDDYEVRYADTIALHYANRPVESLDSLAVQTRMRPDTKETEDTRRFVTAKLRSDITATANWFHDSDDLDIYRFSLSGGWQINPTTRLIAQQHYDYLYAPPGGGLDTIDGDSDETHTKGTIGIAKRFTPWLAMDAAAGYARTDDSDTFVYQIGADLRPADTFKVRLESGYDFALRSPRTVSLAVKERLSTLQVSWTPTLIHTVDAAFSYGDLSDGNAYWALQVAPRISVLRAEKLNLDLGLVTQHFGYDNDLDHGYYDPELYERYGVRAYVYWKIDDDNGMSAMVGWGLHRDDQMDKFHGSHEAALEGYFGIYRDLYLRILAGLAHNLRDSDQPYDAFHAGAIIEYRF